MSAFANHWVCSETTNLDNVIAYDGTVSTDPDNEKFISNESSVENIIVI